MNSQLRQKAINFRINKEMSYTEIRKRLNVPKSTLSYWLRDFPLTEEKIKELQRKGWTKSEASRERFRETMRRQRETKDQTVYYKYQKRFTGCSKEIFFIAGLMLYLGEGGKTDNSRILLANTDPKIVKFFIKWLNKFLGVSKKEIKAQLHLYEDMDIEKEKRFWKNELKLKEEQLYKPSIRKLQKASFSYKESYRHGTCCIYTFGVDRKREIMMAIKAFLDEFEKGT